MPEITYLPDPKDVDDPLSRRYDCDCPGGTGGGSGSGSGAPTTSSYLVLATDASLTSERVLVGTANQVVLTDGGAGGNLTLSLPQSIATTSSPTFVNGTFTGTMGITGVTTLNDQLVINRGVLAAFSPSIDVSSTWNNAGVAFTSLRFTVTDTASAAASLLIDLRVGAVSIFKVDKAGIVSLAASGTAGAPALSFTIGGAVSNTGISMAGATAMQISLNGSLSVAFGNTLTSISGSFGLGGFSADCLWVRDGANQMAMRNGTNAQIFRVYNTFTTAVTNFERLDIQWVTNVCQIWTEKGSTTGTARPLVIGADATELMRFDVGSKISFFGATTVVKQTGPVLNLTNNITAGGTDGTFANFTDLTIYANDAAAIRNDLYQLARSVKFNSDALRAYGLLT